MITISRRLFSILVPLAFFGSCTVAHPVVWKWRESALIHDSLPSQAGNFPLLARTREGKYVIYRREEPKDVEIVRNVSRRDSEQINRDLREWRGVHDTYPYFKVLKEDGALCEVSLEVPDTGDWVIRGTYVLKDGQISSQRILAYFGPGLAIIALPWVLAPGVAGLLVFCLIFRRAPKKEGRATSPRAEPPVLR